MPATFQTLAAAGLAAILACSAAGVALLIAKLRDRALTALAASAAFCAAGYLATQALLGGDAANLEAIVAREVAATSFYIAFCGLVPWIWHRSQQFKARPLLALTTASAALLLASNLNEPYSLRYLSIAPTSEGGLRFEPSGWVFTLASLVSVSFLIAAWSSLQAWRRRDRLGFGFAILAAVAFAVGFFHDLALRDADAGRLRLEGFGMGAMALGILFERLRGSIRFTHLAPSERAHEIDEAFKAPSLVTLILDQEGCVLKVENDSTGSFSKFAGETLWEHPAFSYDERVAKRVRRALMDMTGVSRSRVRTPCRISPRGESWLDLTLQRVADPDDGRTFILAQAKDITQLKEHQEAFGAILHTRSGSDEASSVIISRFSHELRTPLTPIMGFADLILKDGRVPHDLKAHMKIIRSSANTLSENISRVFDMTSSRVEDAEPQREACETQRIVDLLKREAEERLYHSGKEIRVFAAVSELAPPIFFADEGILLEILRKLVDNAVKFTASGEIAIVADCSEDHDLEFVISDTGPGIPEDQRGAIFQAFYQDSSRTANAASGLGLGLTLARCLARQIGAEVGVRPNSRAGSKGAAFALRLANAIPRFPFDESAEPIAMHEFEKRSVLLVEDDDATREFLSRFLNSRGFKVLATASGREALDEIRSRRRRLDLLLLDMRLPDISGFDVARAVRAAEEDGHWESLPILAATAMAQDDRDRDLCIEAGCNAYIPKPIRASELLQKIEDLLPQFAGSRAE